MIGIEGPTFQRIITGLIRMLAPSMFKKRFAVIAGYTLSGKPRDKTNIFKDFQSPVEAVDVIFQLSNGSSVSMQDRKDTFRGDTSYMDLKLRLRSV